MFVFFPLCWLLLSVSSWAASQTFRGMINGVTNIDTILLDHSSGILYLGAKDVILAMDPNDLTKQPQKIFWDVPESGRKICLVKGQKEADCYNFIRLLEFLGDGRAYVCGTYAFEPQCAYLELSSNTLEKNVDGSIKMEIAKGKFPYNRHFSFTAVMADGILYIATPTDFHGREFLILRASGPAKSRTRSENIKKWLNVPEFVSSAYIAQSPGNNPTGEDDNIFFFFTEIAEEYKSQIETKVSRVARICKSDVGGRLILQQKWTTFLKARIVCRDKTSHRYYNILKDVFIQQYTPDDPSSTYFYALFTSLGNTEADSAVCVFNLSDINTVMDGPFKELDEDCPAFTPVDVPSPRPGQCLNNNAKKAGYSISTELPSSTLTYLQRHRLMENNINASLLFVQKGITYTKLAVTPVNTQNRQRAILLHLGTDHGKLHRVLVQGQKTNLLLEMNLFSQEEEPIKHIMLYKDRILVGSPLSLTIVKAGGCDLFRSCEVCAKARRLGCVWNPKSETCIITEIDPGEGDAENAALKNCKGHEGLTPSDLTPSALTPSALTPEQCNPPTTELRVLTGLHILLPCLQLSARSCNWKYPSQKHTKQHPSHLEVNVSDESLGIYVCTCLEGGSEVNRPTPCRRAVYQLTLGCIAQTHDLINYIPPFVGGLLLGLCLLHYIYKFKSWIWPSDKNSVSCTKMQNWVRKKSQSKKEKKSRKKKKKGGTSRRSNKSGMSMIDTDTFSEES